MKIKLDKALFLEKLILSSHFIATRISSIQTLQGVLVKVEKDTLQLFSTNLSSYFHTSIKIKNGETKTFLIEPRKIIEFLNYLSEQDVELEAEEKGIVINSGKTRGKFPIMKNEDFPHIPTISAERQKIKTEFLNQNLPLILFAASSDETRPGLSGVNFLSNDDLVIVSTDGFRLSLIKAKKEIKFPSMLIPADFLRELLPYIKEQGQTFFSYSEKEKMVSFKIEEDEFFSRLIDEDFPPFEKVIPSEKKTTIKLEKEDFLRNIKLISVFARELSNVVILETDEKGVTIYAKNTGEDDNKTVQDAVIEGEKQRIAFNFKFLLEFLVTTKGKTVTIEVLRSDAPVVFKVDSNPDFLHIIMPVRVQE